jgi:homoserine O-succinyltransferase
MSFIARPPSARQPGEPPRKPIVIGLVNNMPDAALRTTERQVWDLMTRAAAATGIAVSFRLFSLSEVPRSDIGRDHCRRFHEPIATLSGGDVAGLIVTGTEPSAPSLEGEPYWPALANLVDWAAHHTVSTIWSCLASHAAAWRLDRIERQPLGGKLFGVFECEKTEEHHLIAGPSRWRVPHSRCNTVSKEALRRAGYRILSCSAEAGVDMFVKEAGSLFVFLQGHPEYDATSLFGEYRRDLRRYLAGERDGHPELPHGYFSDRATAMLLAFSERAERQRDVGLLQEFPAAEIGAELTAPWRGAATRIYANWLSYLAEQRDASAPVRPVEPACA